MSQKTRLIIVLFCVLSFFIVAPILVAYSMGYRYDFEQKEIMATGGIYVRTFPTAEQITIDSNAPQKPGMFGNSVFVQNLLPKQHSVLIKKDGYFEYSKTLEVREKEVTKLENVTLFKKEISFKSVSDNVLSFSVSPNKRNILIEGTSSKSLDFYYFDVSSPEQKEKFSLALPYTSVLDVIWADDSSKVLIKSQGTTTTYHTIEFSKKEQEAAPVSYLDANARKVLFNPQDSSQIFYTKNKTLYSIKNSQQSTVAKNVIDYNFINGKIVWLSVDGQLHQSDNSGKNLEVLAGWPVNKNYLSPENAKIKIISGKVFVVSDGYTYEYISETKNFSESTLGMEIKNSDILPSSDNRNIVYYDNSKIYLYIPTEFKAGIGDVKLNSVLLFERNDAEIISDLFWLNNDYIIFQAGNKIIISEIDYRGNINAVEIPQTYPPSASSATPKMIFNQSDGKIYILSDNILYSSEKLVP